MKKILVALAFGIASLTAFAEASFDQIQSLIEQRQYQAAEQGLEVIIKNHPQSAKAFYAMAQAQAGLGNLDKAQKALNIATGLNPTLDFAPASSVASLKQAITPQAAKIEAVEPSHFWRNFFLGFVLFAAIGLIAILYKRKKDEEDNGPIVSGGSDPTPPITPSPKRETVSSYVPPARPAYRGTPRTVTPTPAPTPAPAATTTYTAPAPTHTTTVVNNSSNDGLLTGVILGNMMSNSHHHDHEVVRERVIEREVPAKSKDSSWDDDSSSRSSSRSSRSSSWDDDSSSSSSSRSSSWSSSSDSSSSSSWDSGSSSSDSSSSSSWD
jgi:uncharacterized membrane protein YgcG